MEFIKENDRVLYLWGGKMTQDIEKQVNELKQKEKVTVNVENTERLSLAGYPKSTFNIILSNIASREGHSSDLLKELLNLVQPKGRVVLKDVEQTEVLLKHTGFINIKNENGLVSCEKPNYEVGSSAKLSFAAKKPEDKKKIEQVWKIDALDDELIDPDELLDEEDLQKPDPTTLRVCGTTGKRKACKDCSCGLAQELAGEQIDTKQTQKSSCGSCYLGDAFRCASCPYLGMPAFKPGEKIQLTNNLLKADS